MTYRTAVVVPVMLHEVIQVSRVAPGTGRTATAAGRPADAHQPARAV